MPRNRANGLNAGGAKDFVLQHEDIVILVMGSPGVGKSTFINAVLRSPNRMIVGHKSTGCTTELEPAVIESFKSPHPDLKNRRVVIVDTPGFDDPGQNDREILQRIAIWLDNCYHKNAILGGVIHLHDISQGHFDGTQRLNLEMLDRICGASALCKVVLGTTKWKRPGLTPNVGKSREDELRGEHWKQMIKQGSKVLRFKDAEDSESALEFVEVILRNRDNGGILQIQKELAIDRKLVTETKAGEWLQVRKIEKKKPKKSKGSCIIC
ncbi:P-loop containing nucleoside triphosphate hydrolase protein [Lyophyllum atratum]|nr:P-loop containing nucleoside triphosphate hydrolase protein [Lyophyllum atratum]